MTVEQAQSQNANGARGSKSKVLHPLEPWRDQPCKCVHCGKVFESLAGLRAHLGHCKSRQLNRYFVVGKYLFTVQCNPLKRKIMSIHDEILETHNEKVIIGLLKGFNRYGLITTFTVIELEGWVKENPLFPDGIVSFPQLKKKMSANNLQSFQLEVTKMKQKVNTPEEQTTQGES